MPISRCRTATRRREMADRYETELDLGNRNVSHTLIVELAGPDKRVLDVGTATGYVAGALKERGCRVTGIELDPGAARKAEEHCERVVVGDVESLDLSAELGEASFEVIVLGDVLEHLRDPLGTLKRLVPFLGGDGYMVASIPNVAHGSVRLALLQGRFPYSRLGLLDDTHLRFFTRESIEQLFAGAGLTIGELERTRRGIFRTEVAVDGELVTEEAVRLVQSDPEAKTYQFVLTAHPANEPGRLVELSNRVRGLSDQLVQKDETIRELQQKLRKAEREPSADGQEAQRGELAERDRKVRELTRKLRSFEDLQRMLDNRSGQLAEKEREVAELSQKLAQCNRQLARLREKE